MKIFAIVILFFSTLSLANTNPYNDNNLELLIPPEVLQKKLIETAEQLDKAYQGKTLTIVMVMKGAVCVTVDLMRQLKTPVNLEYVQASSYGKNGTQRGTLTITGLEKLDIKGKDVLLIDDVLDSGFTLSTIKDKLLEKHPNSIKSLVVFEKKIPRSIAYKPDYAMFEIGNEFIVGYGLDYKEHFRGLTGIYILKDASLVQ